MNRSNTIKIFAGILLFGVLVATLALVSQRQELRRGAYFSTTKLLFQDPNFSSQLNVDLPVAVYVDTGVIAGGTEKAKVDFVQARVCYGPQLSLDGDDIYDRVIHGAGLESIISATVVDGDNGNKCVDFVAKSEKPASNLMSGLVQVAIIKFKSVAVGQGALTFVAERCQVSGYNPNSASTDMAIQIMDFIPSTYVIGNQVTGAVPTATVVPTATLTPIPDACEAVTGRPDGCECTSNNQCLHTCINGVCGIMPTLTLTPTATRIPTATLTLTPTATAIPTATLTPMPGACEVSTGRPDGCECTSTSQCLHTCINGICGIVVPTATVTPNMTKPICIASTIQPETGVAPLTVTLHGGGGAAGGVGIDGYRWDFDNNGTWDTDISMDPVQHTYTIPGTYQPKYQVHNINNIWSDVCDYGYDVQVGSAVQSPAVKFKMTFSGLVGLDQPLPVCYNDWPIKVLALGNGQTMVYTGIIPVRDVTDTTRIVYNVGMTLSGFTSRDGVALFVKGPKHLQVKYGISGQNSQYGMPGGQLTLANVLDDNTPVFDFTGYPDLAGDVVGLSDGSPDGRIDVIDFAAMKAASQTSTLIDTYSKMDLDGNCMLNSNDLEVLKQSLQVKQSELY